MGYFTDYYIDFENVEDKQSFLKSIREISENMHYAQSLEDKDGEAHKWYEHEKDMIAISKKFPDVVFILYGDGEDREDIWKKYFKNGKKQICKGMKALLFLKYDETQLEEPNDT